MNIYQKMSAITKEINTVAKNLQVGEGKNQYKAVGEADVLAAVKPIEIKHGVYSYPFDREIVESGEMVSTTKYGDRKSLYLRVKTIYRFVNVDEPSEFIDITTYGDGVDSQDKAPGKAMTYGDKYALLKAYKIQTGDDPDQDESETLNTIDRTGEPAYPERPAMLSCVQKWYQVEKLLAAYRIDSIDKLTDAQLQALYNKGAEKIKQQKEKK